MDRSIVYSLAAVVAGIAAGAVTGWTVRRILREPGRRAEVRRVADPAGAFSFWFLTALGIVVAVGIASPGSLEPLPGRVLGYLPRVLVAGLTLIGGYAVASICSAVLGQGLARATGRPRWEVTGATRAVILAATVLLAMSQLGLDTTIVTLVVTALLFGIAAALALLVGLGGRDLARDIGAGRYLRRIVKPGDTLDSGDVRGVVAAIHPVTLELRTEDEGTLHIPHGQVLAQSLRVRRPAGEAAPHPESALSKNRADDDVAAVARSHPAR